MFTVIKEQMFVIMQVLKEDTRNQILKIAEELFFIQGFEKTSTRQIATAMNMSVSNLYKYFQNKEEIFHVIIHPYFQSFKNGFVNIIEHEDEEMDDHHSFQLADALFDHMKMNHTKFVILMDKSKGTKYETLKDESIAAIVGHIKEIISYNKEDEYAIKLFARNFFYGIIEIAKRYDSDQWAYNNLKLLVNYHLAGIATLSQ